MNHIFKLSKKLKKMGFHKESIELLKLAEVSMTEGSKAKELMEELASIFSGTRLKESFAPQKILNVPSELNSFFRSNGRGDVTFGSNGVVRELRETLEGGPARDKGSLHGLGLAHDLLINTPKISGSYNIGKNAEIIEEDPELVKLMSKFADTSGLTWGGRMSSGSQFNLDGITVYDRELHHFEIPKSEITSAVHPVIISFMREFGISESSLLTSSGRQNIYSLLIDALSGKEITSEKAEYYRHSDSGTNDGEPEYEIQQGPSEPTRLDQKDLNTLINIGRLFGLT